MSKFTFNATTNEMLWQTFLSQILTSMLKAISTIWEITLSIKNETIEKTIVKIEKTLTLIKTLKCATIVIHLSIYSIHASNLTYLTSFQRVEHFEQRSTRETSKVVWTWAIYRLKKIVLDEIVIHKILKYKWSNVCWNENAFVKSNFNDREVFQQKNV